MNLRFVMSHKLLWINKQNEYLFQIVFQMRLNHAPELVFFSRDNKKRKKDTYDIARYGMNAAGILKWLHERSGVKVRVVLLIIMY